MLLDLGLMWPFPEGPRYRTLGALDGADHQALSEEDEGSLKALISTVPGTQ